MGHFTYSDNLDKTTLYQGDILEKTDEIKQLLEEIHPHYLNESYKYFIVLTQSCDLQRRGGNECKADYITIAACRTLDEFVEKYVKQNIDYHEINQGNIIFNEKKKSKIYTILEHLYNNNEPGYFYLHENLPQGFSKAHVAFLKLSIAIKSNLHYAKCLEAKKMQLDNVFVAKLGWLVGNIYSRVGTEDWVPKTISNDGFKKMINDKLNEFVWTDITRFKKLIKEKTKESSIENFNREELLEYLKSNEPLPAKNRVLSEIKKILEEYISDEEKRNKIFSTISSNSVLTQELK